MSSVTIIAESDHGGSGHAPAVDVTNFSTLRLDFTVASVNATGQPMLEVWLETSSDNSTWSKLHEFRQATAASTQRVILSTHDKYVRPRWLCRSQACGINPECVWGITGEGKPDA